MWTKFKQGWEKWKRDKAISLIMAAYNLEIERCNEIDKLSRMYELENDQHFLDWQDELNKISVR